MILHILKMTVVHTLALAVIAGVILLAAAAWQYAWSADSDQGCAAAARAQLLVARELQRACVTERGGWDNPFARIMCGVE